MVILEIERTLLSLSFGSHDCHLNSKLITPQCLRTVADCLVFEDYDLYSEQGPTRENGLRVQPTGEGTTNSSVTARKSCPDHDQSFAKREIAYADEGISFSDLHHICLASLSFPLGLSLSHSSLNRA